MKNTLLFLLIGLLFVGCSNDPDDSVQEEQEEQEEVLDLKIKSVQSISTSSETYIKTISTFDENGRKNNIYILYQNGATRDYLHTYNDDKKLLRMNCVRNGGSSIIFKMDFDYDTNGTVSRIGVSNEPDNADSPPNSYQEFTYLDNKILIDGGPGSPFDTEFTFNDNDQLTSHNVLEGSKYVYEYSGNNLISIKKLAHSSDVIETHTITYDNTINPLYNDFRENLEDYIYYIPVHVFDMMSHSNRFSENNFTKIEITSANGNTQIIEKETLYNEAGYPISAMVFYDGILNYELAYEYY